MCGIIGIASNIAINNREYLTIGRNSMRHRGPDDNGEWWTSDGRVGFGHNRLSIIDISQRGHQPMFDRDNRICIVYNGELYNHKELRDELIKSGATFLSDCDTEAIVNAYLMWGCDCLSRLNGMFAFAVYDSQKRQVFLARDRSGEKPLYYTISDKTLRFASEVKGILADPGVPRRMERSALDHYLTFGYTPPSQCLIEGIHKLLPGHALLFDIDNSRESLWRYWRPPLGEALEQCADVDETALVNKLHSLISTAVSRQLVADVPVGIMLSGGLDSSIVTALAAQSRTGIKTFTVRFPGHSEMDETRHARIVAQHFDTEHVELNASALNAGLLPMLARQFDDPVADSSIMPTFLVTQLVRQHCKVALGGDGGDELFGGYSHYNQMLRIQQMAQYVPTLIRRSAAQAVETFVPIGVKGRNWLQMFGADLSGSLAEYHRIFDQSSRIRLMQQHGQWNTPSETVPCDASLSKLSLLKRATHMDFSNYLPEDILVKLDRSSMLNSLEVRAPFLDTSVVEFAFKEVPDRLKATLNTRKVLLKRFARQILPNEFSFERKQGFSVPLQAWLEETHWRKSFTEILLSESENLFNRKMVAELLLGQKRGRSNSERLFALVMLQLWRREYRVSF